MFEDLARRLPEPIELIGIRAPGRESRWSEAPFRDAAALVESLVEEAGPSFEDPYGFFGYCTGAFLALDTARSLRRRGLPAPRLLVVASREAPDEHEHPFPPSELDAIDRLRRRGGTIGNAARHPELLRIVRRMAEADYAMFEAYAFVPGEPLDVPISVIAGRDDGHLTLAELCDWHVHTTADFTLRRIEGSHLLLQTSPDAVAAAIDADVRQVLGARSVVVGPDGPTGDACVARASLRPV
jgi:surfactin synthase thioesterase subunit